MRTSNNIFALGQRKAFMVPVYKYMRPFTTSHVVLVSLHVKCKSSCNLIWAIHFHRRKPLNLTKKRNETNEWMKRQDRNVCDFSFHMFDGSPCSMQMREMLFSMRILSSLCICSSLDDDYTQKRKIRRTDWFIKRKMMKRKRWHPSETEKTV